MRSLAAASKGLSLPHADCGLTLALSRRGPKALRCGAAGWSAMLGRALVPSALHYAYRLMARPKAREAEIA